MACPLCDVWNRERENVLFEDEEFVIIRTKFLKGHRERVMLLSKKHIKTLENFRGLSEKYEREIKKIFSYTYKAIVMEGKFGSVPDHWHVCITDLDPSSQDFEQVLGTPWIQVIDIKPWK
jgi:hypothetical protein